MLNDGNKTHYTRDGRFTFQDGALKAADGKSVQGYPLDAQGNMSGDAGSINLSMDPKTKLYGGKYTGFHFDETGKLYGEATNTDPSPASRSPAPPRSIRSVWPRSPTLPRCTRPEPPPSRNRRSPATQWSVWPARVLSARFAREASSLPTSTSCSKARPSASPSRPSMPTWRLPRDGQADPVGSRTRQVSRSPRVKGTRSNPGPFCMRGNRVGFRSSKANGRSNAR